jgi:hypothetical protein
MDSPSKMTAEQAALWARLAAFPLDDRPAVLTFVRRLAKEAGWSSDYTGRVIDEYRRFLFLATVAGHTAVPSEQVDQAWHLHLTYTRSYWGRLCRETLGRQLHHEPTRGGSGEQAKFIALYDETLASYRRFFGVEPPADIWPDAAARFGPDTQHRLVNTARNWVVPKQLVRRLAGAAAGGRELGPAGPVGQSAELARARLFEAVWSLVRAGGCGGAVEPALAADRGE